MCWKILRKGKFFFFFTSPERVTSPIQGPPPSITDRPLLNSVKIFGLINSTVNKNFLVFFLLLLCSYNVPRFSLKKTKLFYLAQFPNDLYSFLIYGNYILSYMRTLFYVIGILSQTLSTQNLGLFTNRSWLSGTHLWSPFLNLTVTTDRRSFVPVTLPARNHSGMSGL